ncbi:MAG: hypothetical protein DDT32_00876 [Syntrophomonadaceae bacterium]|nr:hypothetical protein [Bacillota bacterium]MBT9147124.1 hypothetical protein [Bacillota bacterium]
MRQINISPSSLQANKTPFCWIRLRKVSLVNPKLAPLMRKSELPAREAHENRSGISLGPTRPQFQQKLYLARCIKE